MVASSADDPEPVRQRRVRRRFFPHGTHDSRLRPTRQNLAEPLHRIRSANNLDIDRAIRTVAHRAPQPERTRPPDRPRAEANALDPANDEKSAADTRVCRRSSHSRSGFRSKRRYTGQYEPTGPVRVFRKYRAGRLPGSHGRGAVIDGCGQRRTLPASSWRSLSPPAPEMRAVGADAAPAGRVRARPLRRAHRGRLDGPLRDRCDDQHHERDRERLDGNAARTRRADHRPTGRERLGVRCPRGEFDLRPSSPAPLARCPYRSAVTSRPMGSRSGRRYRRCTAK